MSETLPQPCTVTIERLGVRGDGIAGHGHAAIVVPGALPGEVVEIDPAGEQRALRGVVTPSPDRIAPLCPLFGACGGCATQHVGPAAYAVWKRGLVADALERARIDTLVRPLVDGHGVGRRRVTLHGRRRDGEALAGFMRARSHDLIAVSACPILSPALVRAPEVARALTGALAASAKPLTILITATTGGLDVDVRGNGPPSDKQRIGLTNLAAQLDLARLSIHGDVIVARRAALQEMGKARVNVPPGGFLQPTVEGEAELARLACEAVQGARHVADLFAGSGPFALRLAEHATVHAVEGEAAALSALDKAARATPELRRVTVEPRDLFRRPLLPEELKPFDAVVLDPPRAGAEAQCARLAKAAVPKVVYVSCDVGSFVRDAAMLLQGGYTLEHVTPVDQFRYSAHVELVGVFAKPRARKR
ncbi:MAG: RNA methyltransferase [Hyphomicrobiales bacterium]|nr:RNA methyltransferase [Hyphomicrobiales bacterium]